MHHAKKILNYRQLTMFLLPLLPPLLGLLVGGFLSYGIILYARRYLIKQIEETVQRELLRSIENSSPPSALEETTRMCMHQAITRFREKMPLVGTFINPAIVESMENLMLEQLRKNWPHLARNMVPSLIEPLVMQGLYNPLLIRFWVGYSALLGVFIGLIIELLIKLISR